MYTLHLDLHLYFVPPMTEHGSGIVVTREIELPFPAFEGLRVFSKKFEDCPDPTGFTLKEVVWDIDRKVFLAETSLISQDLPIACIPDSIRDWIEHGWRLGSYCDDYAEPDRDDDGSSIATAPSRLISLEDEERMHTLPPRRRPKEFNRFLKAMVRHMAEGFVNVESAYAIERTGTYLSESDVRERAGGPAVKKWAEACKEFSRMSTRERLDWRDKTSRYPSIEDVILKPEAER